MNVCEYSHISQRVVAITDNDNPVCTQKKYTNTTLCKTINIRRYPTLPDVRLVKEKVWRALNGIRRLFKPGLDACLTNMAAREKAIMWFTTKAKKTTKNIELERPKMK